MFITRKRFNEIIEKEKRESRNYVLLWGKIAELEKKVSELEKKIDNQR